MIFKLIGHILGYYVTINKTPYYPTEIILTKKGYESGR